MAAVESSSISLVLSLLLFMLLLIGINIVFNVSRKIAIPVKIEIKVEFHTGDEKFQYSYWASTYDMICYCYDKHMEYRT